MKREIRPTEKLPTRARLLRELDQHIDVTERRIEVLPQDRAKKAHPPHTMRDAKSPNLLQASSSFIPMHSI
jgi:hypothetical protein